MYHIYTLSDPRTSEVRYVGLSTNAYKRYASHLIGPGTPGSKKDEWIQELLQLRIAPTLAIVDTAKARWEAEKREGDWIRYYLKQGLSLLNISKNANAEWHPPTATNINGAETIQGEEEVRQLLRERGWNLFKRTRGTRTYLYAQKWKKGEVYIAPQSKLSNLKPEEVLQKIAIP